MPTEHLAFAVSPHPFTLASLPQTMTTWAAVTQGFPRIGFPLTTTRRPIFPHLASGIERERMRDRQQTVGMRFQITWFYLTKERAKRRGRDGGSWELQVRPRGWLRGNRPTVHQATNLSSYVMSQVQYSPGRLFKVRPSRGADKKVIYLVATALHESLGLFWSQTNSGVSLLVMLWVFLVRLMIYTRLQDSHSPPPHPTPPPSRCMLHFSVQQRGA